MSVFGDLYDWLAGGRDGYMSLVHCMAGDTYWITLTVILDLLVALGYVWIAHHWWQNEKSLPRCHAKVALGQMKRIFIFCGTCGYLFVPIKLVWPAWRLYDFFMIALVFFTWRYALNARHLRVVYHELGRSKQLAHELEQSKAESRRKSFFLNAISHDLRTPLNGLMLQAELAEMNVSGDDDEGLRESLREIRACARATADLLGSFLELARLEWSDDSLRIGHAALAEIIGHVASGARPVAEAKGLELRIEAPAGVRLQTDRVKVERILQNLVANAIKFTERGRVEVLARVSGGDVAFEVADTGMGIPEGERETIFEEFFQVNNAERDSSKGFGLGLAIARKLARQLGGDLVVLSEVGRGSRFTVSLPGVVEVAAAGLAAPEPVGSRGKPRSAPVG